MGRLSGRNGLAYGALIVLFMVGIQALVYWSTSFLAPGENNAAIQLASLVMGWAPAILFGALAGAWGEYSHRLRYSTADSEFEA